MSTIEALGQDGAVELSESLLTDAAQEFLEHNDAIFKTVTIFVRSQEQNGKTTSRDMKSSHPIMFLHPIPDLLSNEEFFRHLQVAVFAAKKQMEDTQKWNPSEQNKQFLAETEKTYAILQNPFESEEVQHLIAAERARIEEGKRNHELTKVMRCYERAVEGLPKSEICEIRASVTYIDRAAPSIDRTWEFKRSR